ncbi:hypothetical protein OVA14_12005 [Agrococcus sp. SL85]|uniref:hypothetical protein n=1 Tax=Agrococcus sp. SL85 TaxID=2995141 RepID=UPI00226CC62D|nr:hypothetical protein [Agrococcus sp. SL85]WAC66000.1 hypothetical protein OVA14_12005 [Agrococcus sp. SL85]
MGAATTDRRTRWGRVRGTAGMPALAIAIPVGLLLGAAGGAVAAAMIDAPSPMLVGLAVGASMGVPFVALVWALLVDRESLRGVVDRPEESVEGAWYDRAAQGAFSDTILVVGLATAALAVTGLRIDVVVALVGVLLVAMASCGIRYLVARRRG